jgi:hypothetical protein
MERFVHRFPNYAEYLDCALPLYRPVIVDLTSPTDELLQTCARHDTCSLLGAGVEVAEGLRGEDGKGHESQSPPLPAALSTTRITQDLTLLYPLLKKLGFSADCFVLNPPPDLRWDRERLKLLRESDCSGVQEAFAGVGSASEVTIDSTVATLCIALDLCSEYGEGLLIADESTLQRLLFAHQAPHRTLVPHIWSHLVIEGNSMTDLKDSAWQEGQQFRAGVIYFARSHEAGPPASGSTLYQPPVITSPQQAKQVCVELREHRRELRLGRESKSFDHTEDTVEKWQAAEERADGKPIRLSDRTANTCYTVTLGPGVVRYMKVENFLEGDVEAVVAYIRSLSENPTIDLPLGPISPRYFEFAGALITPNPPHWVELDLAGIDAMIQGVPWDTRLRVHHHLCRFFLTEAMPSYVYAAFHVLLCLKQFAPDECLNAWVRKALGNDDIITSYENDPSHLVVAHRGGRYVFAKTPFVLDKLNAVQQDEGERKALMESELLRRSKFDCFIYLMEDLRNRSFKIGRSKTPGKRERTLQSEVPQVVMRISIPAEEECERQLHSHFVSKRFRGEWFTLTNDDLVWIVAFLKANGDSSRAIVDYNWLGTIHFTSTPIAPNK